MKYFNEASALYMFLTLDIKWMNDIRLICRPIHAPNHELEDTGTNTPATKVISKRVFVELLDIRGTAVAQWLRCCATNQKVASSIPAGVSGFFIDTNSFRSHYGPGVDSASNRNEHQEHFLGGKGGRCVRLTTYHHPVLLSRNLGTLISWKPLGLSRPVMGLLYLYILLGVREESFIRYLWGMNPLALFSSIFYVKTCLLHLGVRCMAAFDASW